jgi:DNA-binding response OmpR family regulator
VLILSSRDKDEDIERGFRVGADGYLTKSGGQDEFLTSVREFLDRQDIIRNRKVLVVDDSAYVRAAVGEALEKSGFHVAQAENGRQALDRLLAARCPTWSSATWTCRSWTACSSARPCAPTAA